MDEGGSVGLRVGGWEVFPLLKELFSLPSSRMRSDGFDEEGHRAEWKPRNPQLLDLVEDDLLRARSWNKKLYECEANMPDRSVGESRVLWL